MRTTAKLWLDANTWGGAIDIICISTGVGEAGTVGSALPPTPAPTPAPKPALAPAPAPVASIGPSSNSVSDTMRGVVDLDFARERERESCRRVKLAPFASSCPEAAGAAVAASAVG